MEKSYEYGGDRWVILDQDNWPLNFPGADPAVWHKTFAEAPGGERAWEVARRYYGVGTLSRPQSYMDAADIHRELKKEGYTLDEIKDHIEKLSVTWSKNPEGQRGIEAAKKKASAKVPNHKAEDVEHIAVEDIHLDDFGLGDIKDEGSEDEIEHAVKTVRELRHLFENPATSFTAQQLVRQELSIRTKNLELTRARKEVKAKSGSYSLKDIQKMEEDRTTAINAYRNLRKELKLDRAIADLERGANYRDDLSYLVKAVTEWMSKDENTLIDGLHTAAEIDLLMKEYVQRPSQYRPDVARTFHIACQTEHLFDLNWSGFKLRQLDGKKMLKHWVKYLEQVRDEEDMELEDLESDTRDDDMDTLRAQQQSGNDNKGEVSVGSAPLPGSSGDVEKFTGPPLPQPEVAGASFY